MKKSSPKIIIGFEKKKKFTRDKFQIDKTIQILQMLQIHIYIYIYIYIYCGGKKTNKLPVHPYRPVTWLPTHQGI